MVFPFVWIRLLTLDSDIKIECLDSAQEEIYSMLLLLLKIIVRINVFSYRDFYTGDDI